MPQKPKKTSAPVEDKEKVEDQETENQETENQDTDTDANPEGSGTSESDSKEPTAENINPTPVTPEEADQGKSPEAKVAMDPNDLGDDFMIAGGEDHTIFVTSVLESRPAALMGIEPRHGPNDGTWQYPVPKDQLEDFHSLEAVHSLGLQPLIIPKPTDE